MDGEPRDMTRRESQVRMKWGRAAVTSHPARPGQARPGPGGSMSVSDSVSESVTVDDAEKNWKPAWKWPVAPERMRWMAQTLTYLGIYLGIRAKGKGILGRYLVVRRCRADLYAGTQDMYIR